MGEARAAEDTPTLTGHFAVFNQWTRIDSTFEGLFLERVAPGAFAHTLAHDRSRIAVLFQHGRDPQIGGKPLGVPTVLREDGIGVAYEVPLLDTAYVAELLPGLRAGVYGASFRCQVLREQFDQRPAASGYNPRRLPERTLQEVRLFDLGPVIFPAYDGATASVRSLSDWYHADERQG